MGLPILFDKSKKAAFQEAIDEVQSKIKGLFQAGRSELIQSVTATIPSCMP
jgi:hypothetical protein